MTSPGCSGRPLLLLGGAGFIGTRLASLLISQGVPIRIADRVESQAYPQLWTRCDVTQDQPLRELARDAEAIVNLAAEHRDDVRPVSRYHEVNVEGAKRVCDSARAAGVSTIVFTSSVAVYGFHARAVDEDGPFAPFNEYGRTKLQAESIYRAWAEEDPLRSLVIIRPTVVFGEGNRGNVYNLLRQMASGRFFMVGSGTNVKSMAYVGNVAAFLAHSLTLGPGIHIANYVDTPDLTTRDLVLHLQGCLGIKSQIRTIPKGAALFLGKTFDVLAAITGRRFPVSAIRVRKFCETTQFMAERPRQWGFQPPYTLVEALSRTVEFEFGAADKAPDRMALVGPE